MRKNKRTEEELNSGILEFGTKETLRGSTKKIISTAFKSKGILYFKFKSMRQSDYSLFWGLNKTVDVKVKTYFSREVESTHIIKIEDSYYDIENIDIDENKRYMYWYLVKRGEL